MPNWDWPYRTIPRPVALPLPDVLTPRWTLASQQASTQGCSFPSPQRFLRLRPLPSAEIRHGTFRSCACPPHLMRYSEAL